jgi:NAD(P)H-hydrate epimerase
MNSAHVPLVAVDIPSGLPAEPLSREMLAARPVVRASRTVTIGRPKVGMFVGAGVACTGSVSVEEIGFPLDLLEAPHIAVNLMTLDEARALLPPRDPAGHKGTFGKVLLTAGSVGMTGAAVLAARAAMRSGAGLVYSAYPEPLSAIMESHLIEPVKLPLPGAAPWFTGAQAAEVLALAAGMQAVGIGPGLGQRPETAEFVRAVVCGVRAPLVIDADGLNLLSGMLEVLADRPGETILTPHPGEAARLLGLPDAAAVEADRLGAFVEFTRRHRCVVVLKGAQTVLTTPDGARWVNPTGGSGLAKGGSGDVLTGLLTALLGQGLPAAAAARLGVFVHGMAGDQAAQELTARAMVAGDVIEIGLPRAFKALERA